MKLLPSADAPLPISLTNPAQPPARPLSVPSGAAGGAGKNGAGAAAAPANSTMPNLYVQHNVEAEPVVSTGGGADSTNPFDDDPDRAPVDKPWSIEQKTQAELTTRFYDLKLASGVIGGQAAKELFVQSGLPTAELRQIWKLSDRDKDGALDLDEYILCQYLIQERKRNPTVPVPQSLPIELIPPSKRHLGDV